MGVFHQGHLVEFLNMSSSSLKAIPCSLVKCFPNLKWWDLRSTDLLRPMTSTNVLWCTEVFVCKKYGNMDLI